MVRIKAPGDHIVQTAGEYVDGEKQEQYPGPDAAVPEEGEPYDGITAGNAIQDEQENMQGC